MEKFESKEFTKSRQNYVKNITGRQTNDEKATTIIFGVLLAIILLAISR